MGSTWQSLNPDVEGDNIHSENKGIGPFFPTTTPIFVIVDRLQYFFQGPPLFS